MLLALSALPSWRLLEERTPHGVVCGEVETAEIGGRGGVLVLDMPSAVDLKQLALGHGRGQNGTPKS